MSTTADPVPRSYLVLFASLYAIQGIVIGYFFNFNQGYMKGAGVGPDTIGFVQSVALIPLILRFLGGPLSDRINLLGLGHRRPYIVLGLTVQGMGLVGLTLCHPARHIAGFTALAIFTVIGLAIYDTAADGFILDTVPASIRSRTQGLLIAARFLGAMLSSVGFGLWLEHSGTGPGRGDGVLWACAGLGIVPLTLALILPERPRDQAGAETFQWEALRVMIQSHALVLLAFGTFYAIVAYAVEINLSPYYRDLGYSEGSIGAFGATRYIGRAVGAAILGLAMRRWSRRNVLVFGIGLLALGTCGQVGAGSRPAAGAMAFLFGLANGWNDAIFYVLAMEASSPRMAASTCALFMSVTNLSVTGGWFFARLASTFGGPTDPRRYVPAFWCASLIVLIALVFVPALSSPPGHSDHDLEAADVPPS